MQRLGEAAHCAQSSDVSVSASVGINLAFVTNSATVSTGASIDAEELLTGARIRWHGKIQRMHLDPHANPCAIWRLTPMEAQS